MTLTQESRIQHGLVDIPKKQLLNCIKSYFEEIREVDMESYNIFSKKHNLPMYSLQRPVDISNKGYMDIPN